MNRLRALLAKGGPLADNIREPTPTDNLDELRESMRSFGWIRELPALCDERGLVLVGHRRLKVAEELGIRPIIRELTIGDGEEADAERLKLAIASNIGSAPMTKEDRQRIAEYLYGERKWTMERIAAALGVGLGTVSRDLGGFSTVEKPPARPKGGRPKGAAKHRNPAITPGVEQALARAVLDDGKALDQAAAEFGVGSGQVAKVAVAYERGRRDAAGTVDPELLPKTTRQKLETAIRQHKRRLDAEFEERVRAHSARRLDEMVLPEFNRQKAYYDAVVKGRKGLMTRRDYRKILACLHPDRVRDPALKADYEAAFRLFASLEISFCNEEEFPTGGRDLPKTAAELLARRKRPRSHVAKESAHESRAI